MTTPTADQKRWEMWLRKRGCWVTGAVPSIHHIKGREFNLKGVDKAGHWYIIPLSPYWHKWDAHEFAVHTNRKSFEHFLDFTQKDIFIDLVLEYEKGNGQKPMSDFVFEQIVLRA